MSTEHNASIFRVKQSKPLFLRRLTLNMQALLSSKLQQLLTGCHGATARGLAAFSETPLKTHISQNYYYYYYYYYYLLLLLLLNLMPEIQEGEQTDVRLHSSIKTVYTGLLLSLKRGTISRLLAHMYTHTHTHTQILLHPSILVSRYIPLDSNKEQEQQ